MASVRIPSPVLMSEAPLPARMPVNVVSATVLKVRWPAARAVVPVKSREARCSVSPNCTAPPSINKALANDRWPLADPITPPLRFSMPGPKARSLPASNVPSRSVVPPAYEFDPERTRAPRPSFVIEPLAIAPVNVASDFVVNRRSLFPRST